MSYSPNINTFGGGITSTTVFGGSTTSGTKFGNIFNTITNSALNSSNGALSGAINGALSLNPYTAATGSLLKSVAGIDLSVEIGKVSKYGLNSWGASTTPEGIGKFLTEFEQNVYQLINEIENGSLEHLTELSRFINWGIQFYSRMRKNHAKANSTKKAYDLAKQFFSEMKSVLLDPLVTNLKKIGVINEIPVTKKSNMYLHLGKPVFQSDPSIKYNEYTVNVDVYNDLIEKSIENGKKGSDQIDESNSTGALGLLGIGLAIYKIFN